MLVGRLATFLTAATLLAGCAVGGPLPAVTSPDANAIAWLRSHPAQASDCLTAVKRVEGHRGIHRYGQDPPEIIRLTRIRGSAQFKELALSTRPLLRHNTTPDALVVVASDFSAACAAAMLLAHVY